MPKRQSLWKKIPDYPLEVEPSDDLVRARVGGEVVAESRATLTVREAKYDPVVYFPRDDVRLDLARRSEHESFCPFKGEAAYWSFGGGGEELADVAWSYERPFAEVAELQGHVAFYADRVEVVREVCNLPEPELRERIARLRREILPQATRRERTPGGVVLEFPHTPALARTLDELVAFERRCCGGLDWTLERGGDALVLRVDGLAPDSELLRAFD